MKNIILLLFALLSVMQLEAKVPTPPDGKRWVLNAQFSDEFNGTSLDRTKWNNTFDGWKGRKPAMFNSEAVSVSGGYLQIQSGVLDVPTDGYTIYGGAVQSTTSNASFGYYECSFKASQLPMSTTFWLSNSKTALEEESQMCSAGNYPKYSQELDIQECVGDITSTASWCQSFDKAMHSNTHFRIVKCGESSETFYSRGADTELGTNVYGRFNTYASWWVDETQAMFYANDDFFETVVFKDDFTSTPFARPMRINMVTETYDWNPCSKDANGTALEDPSVNISYYDWIRSWYLVDINDSIAFEGEMPLGDVISFYRDPVFYDGSRILKLRYEYEAKVDRLMKLSIVDKDNNVVEVIEKKMFAGSGRVKYEEFQTDTNFGGNNPYKLVVDLCAIDDESILFTLESDLGDIVAGLDENTSVKPMAYINNLQQLCFKGFDHQADIKLYDLNGVKLKENKISSSETIDISHLSAGLYLVSIDNKTQLILKKDE